MFQPSISFPFPSLFHLRFPAVHTPSRFSVIIVAKTQSWPHVCLVDSVCFSLILDTLCGRDVRSHYGSKKSEP